MVVYHITNVKPTIYFCRKFVAAWVQAIQQLLYSCVAVQTRSATLQPTGTSHLLSCHS